METILSRYESIQMRIRTACQKAGRDASDITLVAVSKTKPFSMIEELYQAGHRDFGENYVQELTAKAEEAALLGMRDLRWHFIGHLQTNKVKQLIPHVHLIHSVGSEKLLREIEKRAEAAGKRIPAMLEVNLDQEPSKSGLAPAQIGEVLRAAHELKHVDVKGLMAIPDPDRAEGALDAFRRLATLAREHALPELSMGMTSDFEDAIAAGSRYVRVGTAIFGERT